MPLQYVVNGAGQEVLVYAPGIENVQDVSNVIAAANTSQQAIASGPTGPCCNGSPVQMRSGWFIQNVGSGTMYVNETNAPATESVAAKAGSIAIAPRESIGTLAGCTVQVPLTFFAVNIIGTNTGDGYVARVW